MVVLLIYILISILMSTGWTRLFKDTGISNKYTIEFRGGGSKFRYYTMVGLLTDKGFVKSPNENDGYSTQNKY